MSRHRSAEYRRIMTAIGVVCGVAALGSVVPLVEHLTNLVLLTLAGLLVAVAGLRFAVRAVRERLQDRADERTAEQLRAQRAAARALRVVA